METEKTATNHHSQDNCCWKLFHKIFPYGCKTEIKEQIHIAWPIAATQLLQFLLVVTSLAFCGHLNTDALNGVALATTVISITGNSVILGLSSACDTLFAQTFGNPELKEKLGVVLQKSIIIISMCCIPCACMLLNTKLITTVIGQAPGVIRYASIYATLYIIALPGNILFQLLSKYLQAQSIVYPSMVIGFLVNLISAGLHALFLYGLNMGVFGAGTAIIIAQWLLAIFHLLYIITTGIYKETWKGWTVECLYDWKIFISLSIPGLLMVCLEWWCYEIIAFVIAGVLDPVSFGAHVILYTLLNAVYMIPLGLSVGASVRVGNHLGAQEPFKALTASRVSICLVFIVAILLLLVFVIFKDFIPKIYSGDSQVLSLSTSVMPLVGVVSFFDAIQGTTSGVVRGVGRQAFGAASNFLGYYIFSLPITMILLFLTDMGIYGVWLAVISGSLVQSVVFIIRVLLLDWNEEVKLALLRTRYSKNMKGKTYSTFTNEKNSMDDSLQSSVQLFVENSQKEKDDTVPSKTIEYERLLRIQPNLKKVVIQRLIALCIFLLILGAAIGLRIYCDSKNDEDNSKCAKIISSHINRTAFYNLFSNLTDFDSPESKIMNVTFWFEQEHMWNTSFIYCFNNSTVNVFTNETSVPEYDAPWLVNS